MNTEKLSKSIHKDNIEKFVRQAEQLRKDPTNPQDVSLGDILEMNGVGLSLSELYEDLGIDPTTDTIENLFTMPDSSIRWLVPEIFRDALKLGLRKAPIYPNVIAAEQSIKGLTAVIPAWNMSEAKPRIVGEGETISLGTVSTTSKSIAIKKYGRGLKVSYEVKNYVSINIVSIFMQDFGIKMGMGLDNELIRVLLNGDVLGGGEAITTIGIATANTLVFGDLLKAWIRMSRLGKNMSVMIGGEDAALKTLSLTEYTQLNQRTGANYHSLNLKTPMPQNSDYYVHGAVPANVTIILDPASTVIKFNAQPLLVESEKIVSNQTEATYATFTTGFGTLLRDSRLAIDTSQTFAAAYFPATMDPATEELVVFD